MSYNSACAEANNTAVSNNPLLAYAHQLARDAEVWVNWKEFVPVEKSDSGLIGVTFHTPEGNQSETLLAYVTLFFKGVVMTGFSLRLFDNNGKEKMVLLAPSRPYQKGGKTKYAAQSGFGAKMGDSVLVAVKAAFEGLVG
jgi:hypothetical protein